MKLKAEFEGLKVVQETYKAFGNEYHRYAVLRGENVAYSCKACADCRKNKRCKGLPSVTSVSGQYGGGGLYPAGYRHALDAVFGEYTDKAKDAVKDGGWMSDYVKTARAELKILASIGEPTDGLLDVIKSYRQEVEEIPTPGKVSAAFGTKVHAALESVLKGKAEVPMDCADAVEAVTDWLRKGGADGPYVIQDAEVNVFHPELLIAGQVDCVARCGNRVILIDWKSGKAIYPNHAIQIAAYAMCYEAMTGEEVAECWIVKSGKHGFEAKMVKDVAPAQKAFIALQQAKQNIESIQWADEF